MSSPSFYLTESEALADRLINCLPAATFEMETLCRLAGIEACPDVPTAAVTCEGSPRLLLNPDFVAQRCQRDEHLFLLVMHELWHVLLAHTTLYPRSTVDQNIAFDAVINAGLSREVPGPEYRGFFEELNPADTFPALLLRPPEGWPRRPHYPEVGVHGVSDLLRRLYPSPGHPAAMPTYTEILDLLKSAGATARQDEARERPGGEDGQGCPGPVQEGPGAPALLGDHEDLDGERKVLDDDLFGDIIRRIVGSWPPPPLPLGGRDLGRPVRDWTATLAPVADEVRQAFARVLRRALGPRPGLLTRRVRASVQEIGGTGVLPNPADRLAPARHRLTGSSALWAQPAPTRVRRPERPARSHVYLDVSGSMLELLPYLVSLLVPYLAAGTASAYQFSNLVAPVELAELRQGTLRTTGGTDIRCVLEHALAVPRLRKALVLTDGYTGAPDPQQLRRIRERQIDLHVVLPAESAWRADLEAAAKTVTVLPALRGKARPWRI